MRAEVRADRVERLPYPLLDAVRVEVVDQQQARHQVVGRKGRHHVVVQPAGLLENLQHPAEARAVQVGHAADEFLSAQTSPRATGGACFEQRLDTVAGGA